MSDTWVMTRREFRSYFLSPIAYVVGLLFLVIGAYQFFQVVFIDAGRAAEARMQPYFMMLPLFFLVLIPALSMRLWAEERKLGTLELLLTFPVRTVDLIAGKFMGAMMFVGALLALTLLYPITLALLGNLDWGPVIGGYAGALLLAAAYLSLGMFVSSLTRDQIIALIISVSVLAGLHNLPLIAAWFLPAGFVEFVEVISPVTHFRSIARGVVDVSDVLYYAAFSGFFLFLNGITLEIRKWIG